MKTIDIVRADGTVLCEAQVANNFLTRMVGLLGRASLKEDRGLLIEPCSSVHTLFMRFPIDVVYLDSANKVVKLASLPRFRLSLGGRGAKKVIELPASRVKTQDIRLGESLTFREANQIPAGLS